MARLNLPSDTSDIWHTPDFPWQVGQEVVVSGQRKVVARIDEYGTTTTYHFESSRDDCYWADTANGFITYLSVTRPDDTKQWATQVQQAAETKERKRVEAEAADHAFRDTIRDARNHGVDPNTLAEWSGLTRTRIFQILGHRRQ